jgi:uncharacterized protein YbaR (Trm112 family)
MDMIDDELLQILACPACHEAVREEDDKILCTGCGRRYPIRDGVPVMLLDEAESPGEKIVDTSFEVASGDSAPETKIS